MKILRPTVAAGLLFAACASVGESPRATAEAFLDRHYLAIDLAAARELCVDVARAKLDEEMELTADVAIDAQTRKPRIDYRQGHVEESADRARYQYELEIEAGGYSPFKKHVLLTLRRTDVGWRIANYSESDPA